MAMWHLHPDTVCFFKATGPSNQCICWFLIQVKPNHDTFINKLLAIVASFEEWGHFLWQNPNRLEVISNTNYCNLEVFMTEKAIDQIETSVGMNPEVLQL